MLLFYERQNTNAYGNGINFLVVFYDTSAAAA